MSHDEASVASGGELEHTQQQQSEFTEVSPAQASLGTTLPLATLRSEGSPGATFFPAKLYMSSAFDSS